VVLALPQRTSKTGPAAEKAEKPLALPTSRQA